MLSRKSASILSLVLAIVAIVASMTGYVVLSIFAPREVTVRDINANPQSFKSIRVRVYGYLVNASYMFGPQYVLRDNGSEIALSPKNGPGSIDFAKYVSFILDSEDYAQIRDMTMSVVGHVRYVGFVIDAPPFYIEVENAELKSVRWDQVALGTQQIRVEVDKSRYSIGEPVRFRLFNRNLGNEPIFAGVFNIEFRVSNSRGESVVSIGIDPLWPSDFTVNPGEEIELHGILPPWNQINNKRVQVPLGPYTIRIEMDTIGSRAALCLKIEIAIQCHKPEGSRFSSTCFLTEFSSLEKWRAPIVESDGSKPTVLTII